MSDVPAIASFNPQQRQAAKLFAKGLKTREIHEELDVPMRTLQDWNRKEEFQMLVSFERDQRVVGPVSLAVRRKLGHMSMDEVGENLMDNLLNILNFDPVGLQNEDGSWKNLDDLPPEVRVCIKRPGTEKSPPEFYCKQKAGDTMAKIMMAWEQSKMEVANRRLDEEAYAEVDKQ